MPKACTSTARERELYRYYCPAELSHTSIPEARRSANDPCLAAFAQLGALRLNAKRGFIILSTQNKEYVIAESGKALSLQEDDDEQDKLWNGVGLLPSKGGKSMVTTLFSDPLNTPSHIVIDDLTKDPRFSDKKPVVDEPHMRALAAAPLRTHLHNIVIGQYVVIDDRVRDGLNEAELRFLTDMATTVMDYLEAGRLKGQQYRADRMVKAIGLFIEGKTTLRDWWLERGHKSQQVGLKKRSREATPLEKLADIEFGVQDTTDYFSRNSLHSLPDSNYRASIPQSPSSAPSSQGDRFESRPYLSSNLSQSDRGDGRPPIPRGDTLLSSTDSATPSTYISKSELVRTSSVTTFDTITDITPDAEKHNSVSFDLPPDPVISQANMPKELQEAVLSTDVKNVFARASNLIREAIGVEGVIYFDASIGSFGGSSEQTNMDEKPPGGFHAEHPDKITSSEDDLGRRSSDNEIDPTPQHPANHQSATPSEKYCNVLGYSTRRRSSLRGHPVAEEHQRFPEAVLRKLLKRYPHGKVFNFDEDGSFSSSESDPNISSPGEGVQADSKLAHRSTRRRLSREAEASAILSVLPGARSVFWFPLWSQPRERWFAGSLVWSTCTSRTLCPLEDITYLAAFGNSTMAEIARLSAQVLSKMKTDFISSISHELRSPLHGVLASVEFLQETPMTEDQVDMVNNIHASGKVLLDTINHVLDFSKVNRRSKEKKRLPKRRQKKFDRRQSVDDGSEDKADVCVLSEEVLESVYAGQRISKKAFGLSGHRRQASTGEDGSPVTVIVDIQWHANWTFEIDAGAWRRILMNLFSNAMKYTEVGFVNISLDLEDDVTSRSKHPRSNLTLRIKDSGKGISREFLKHQLYKPFTQEDSLASGAGLGLSIVKAIVQDLGGKIEFNSEAGTGTEAIVRIPLTASVASKSGDLDLLVEVRKVTKGLNFRLEAFDRYPDITETPTGILSAEAEAAMLLKSTMQESLTEWFQMEAITGTADLVADVVVVMESGLGDRSLVDTLQPYTSSDSTTKSIAIVLSNSYHPSTHVDSCGNFRILHLQQPYGPHKIAKILHHALIQKNISAAESVALHTPSQSISFTISTEEPPQSPLPPPTEVSLNGSATHDFAKQYPVAEFTTIPGVTQQNNGEIESPIQQKAGLRVLLVEDNEINLKLLIACMRKLKLDHATATNGLEALNSYKESEGRFDVVFMDISMPVMSGIESTKHIRRFEKEKGLEPVALIALTGAANPNTRQEAFSSGVDLFLTKPVPMKALRGMLEDLRREGRAAFAGFYHHRIATPSTGTSTPIPIPIPPPQPSSLPHPQDRTPRRQGTVETASQAGPSSAYNNTTSSVTANPRIPSPSFQPPYPTPSPIPHSATPEPQVRITSPTRWSLRNALIGGGNPDFASPFRSRSGTGGSNLSRGRPRRPSAARLWNPSNSTPRGQPPRSNRSPEDRAVIAVPLHHPDLNSPREGAGAGGEYPLLTLPEQRQSRHSGSTIASLQVERSGSSNGTRISLPRSVSIEIQRRKSGEASPGLPKLDKGKGRAVEEEEPEPKVTGLRKRGQSISNIEPGLSFDKGKGKATMSTDIERGRDTQSPYTPGGTANVPDNASLHSGIGAALSSNNTSIIGSDGPPGNPAEEWGPQHPCFPHMNPHVPLSSQLYQTTRIIRIRRDWMLEGDLAPTFSNLYPEILDPAGVSEQDFRQLVEKVNNELIPAFNPWSFRNILDAMLGLVTGWIWDDLGFTAVKGRLRKVEGYLEEWNREMEGKVKDGSTPGSAPRIVPLRRTGYMNLDIQVPDPEILYPSSIPPEDRTATGLSRVSQ